MCVFVVGLIVLVSIALAVTLGGDSDADETYRPLHLYPEGNVLKEEMVINMILLLRHDHKWRTTCPKCRDLRHLQQNRLPSARIGPPAL